MDTKQPFIVDNASVSSISPPMLLFVSISYNTELKRAVLNFMLPLGKSAIPGLRFDSEGYIQHLAFAANVLLASTHLAMQAQVFKQSSRTINVFKVAIGTVLR